MSDWEDIAIGGNAPADDGLSVTIEPIGRPTAQPQAAGEWEDVASGPALNAAPTPDTSRNFETITGAMTRGAAFGSFDDEILGGEYALRQAIAGLFGAGNGRTMAENYTTKSKAVNAQNQAFQKENPWTSFGANVAGGLLPAAITGGASLASGVPLVAKGVSGSAIKTLFGLGMDKAPGLLRLAGMGAAGGAVSGFGEGRSFSERVQNSALGSAIGAVFAPAAGKTLEYGIKGIGNLTAPLRSRVSFGSNAPMVSEAGGIPINIKEPYTPGELLLARELRDVPEANIQSAIREMSDAADTGTPLFLPEAINDRGVNRNAQFIANNKDSASVAGEFIDARSNPAAVSQRTNATLDLVSPEASTFDGARRATTAAETILEDIAKARSAAAKPVYDKVYAEQPVVINPALDDFLAKDYYVNAAIADIKKANINADLPENSTQLLVKAKGYVYDAAQTAKRAGDMSKSRDIMESYNTLRDILQQNKALKAADALYAEDSKVVDALNETFLKSLSKMTNDKVENFKQVFNLSPQRINQLKQLFKADGKEDEWNAGIRSYLQGTYEKAKDGRNFAGDIVDSPALRDKLQAALGENFDAVVKGFQYESRFAKGKNVYNSVSSTAPLLGEKESFKVATGILGNIKNGNYMAALGSLLSSDLDAETAKEMARIYFGPNGKTSLEKVIPLLKAYGSSEKLANLTSQQAEKVTRPAANRMAAEVSGTNKKPSAISQTMAPKKKGSAIRESFSNKKNIAMSDADSSPELIKAVEREIDSDPFDAAVYEMESSRNPNAKNPKSSASGGFQLINSTAKKLGVKDVFDLGQNYEGFKALKDENIARFGNDPRSLYSAHFLGATLFAKLRRGAELTEKEQGQVDELMDVALPRFMKIYKKTASKTVEA